MTARTDPRIPELINLTEAAALLGCSKNWLTKLHKRGQLVGHRVGSTLVMAAAPVRALAQARHDGQQSWDPPAAATIEIPELMSTTEAAAKLGLAQRNWIGELYRRGELPGRQVGQRTIVVAAETVDEVAEERRIGLNRYLGEHAD